MKVSQTRNAKNDIEQVRQMIHRVMFNNQSYQMELARIENELENLHRTMTYDLQLAERELSERMRRSSR